ncbi:MAG: hypothetical protein ACTSRI_20885 [Promethearchaeota archaeon]
MYPFLKVYQDNPNFKTYLNTFINELETDIFIKFFEELELPELPSTIELKGYELKERRIPKIAQSVYHKKNPFEKSEIIQELSYLKNELNGHKVNITLDAETISPYDNTTELEKDDKTKKEDSITSKQRKIKNDLTNLKKLKKSQKNSRLINLVKEEKDIKEEFEDNIVINFDKQVKELISKDIDFITFLSQIEVSLYQFYKNHINNYECLISIEKDFEVTDLSKLILSIDVKNLSIDEKLDLWDELDSFLREKFEELSDLMYISKDQTRKYQELNQYFYTNIILN